MAKNIILMCVVACLTALVLVGRSPDGLAITQPDYKGDPQELSITSQSLDGAVMDTQIGSITVISLASDVFFGFDEANLTSGADAELREVAKRLRDTRHVKLRVDGYTDSVGSAAYNEQLSKRRADAVRSALAAQLPGVTIEAAGHGAADPFAPNKNADGSDNPDGRAKNRRVTLTFGG